eukprot:TRINITY_DN3287_c0_g1_i2.p1 TRINITY_DN3287_c0_g1~~TRINITY_DN3287_c0_g1_i2.p1  ORF type:complete len:324 (-),score=80.41 TRINITY_DN3287_c0_g1_i2:14-844(-)
MLEQYATSPNMAAHFLHAVESKYGDISESVVLDLGCGTGVLSVGCLLLGCDRVVGIEYDKDALAIARENLENFDFEEGWVKYFQGDVTSLRWDADTNTLILPPADLSEEEEGSEEEESEEEEASEEEEKEEGEDEEEDEDKGTAKSQNASELLKEENKEGVNEVGEGAQNGVIGEYPEGIQIVVMNPPFGTKVRGIDMEFLEIACSIATTAVYSLHKTSTVQGIMRRAKKWNVTGEVVAEMRWQLPNTMKYHKRRVQDIAVSLLRFDPCMYRKIDA